MKNTLDLPKPITRKQIVAEKRASEKLLSPFDEIALNSNYLISKPLTGFESDGQQYQLPRYVFLGPKGGGDTIRIGIFATIHGDEPEGALALVRFITALEKNPELAKGYALFIYPLCNPTGFEDNTRHSRAGVDLNREFWIESSQPEVSALETAARAAIKIIAGTTRRKLHSEVFGRLGIRSVQRHAHSQRSAGITSFLLPLCRIGSSAARGFDPARAGDPV